MRRKKWPARRSTSGAGLAQCVREFFRPGKRTMSGGSHDNISRHAVRVRKNGPARRPKADPLVH